MANRSCSDARIRAQLGFSVKHCMRAFVIHHQNDKGSSLAACLQSKAATARLHHNRSTPVASEVLSALAVHHSTAVPCGNDETSLFTEGSKTTHSALFKILRGTPLGPLSNSLRTSPEAVTLACSVESSAALARKGIKRHRIATA